MSIQYFQKIANALYIDVKINKTFFTFYLTSYIRGVILPLKQTTTRTKPAKKMKELTKKIATLLDKPASDNTVKAIAQTWVELVEHAKGKYNIGHEEADSMVHWIFKNDPDTFAELCKLNLN